VEANVVTLLALQAPVAGDLRAVVSSLRNVADVDRMGALALHVAKLARRRHPAKALPEEVNGYFTEMGRIAVDIGNSVKDVVLSGDPDRAAQLADDDDDMDNLHRHPFSVVGSRMETRRRGGSRHHLAGSLLRAIRRPRRRDQSACGVSDNWTTRRSIASDTRGM
jgi:phosphate uptake regulator